jgi:hypothetical protein
MLNIGWLVSEFAQNRGRLTSSATVAVTVLPFFVLVMWTVWPQWLPPAYMRESMATM